MFVYLHGFASGPLSTKAQHFRRAFGALGLPLEIPALDEGDFEHLTLSGQLRVVERLLADRPGPHVLLGSSMGGYLAALHAAKHEVAALVLMAPAVDFAARWQERLGPDAIAQWREAGSVEVFHHALGRTAPLAFGLYEDALRHAPWPRVTAPTLVLHGRNDDVVPQARVERWVGMNPSATLRLYESGHELTDCMDALLEETLRFLAGIERVARTWPALAARSSHG
ncbi:MAG: YqiA/YcfP family alpha/beta fold hydrolase [Myxococcales bacterium]